MKENRKIREQEMLRMVKTLQELYPEEQDPHMDEDGQIYEYTLEELEALANAHK
ncbi:MAG: hypothetical protein ACI3VZ_00385 [Faecousia sp.]